MELETDGIRGDSHHQCPVAEGGLAPTAGTMIPLLNSEGGLLFFSALG